MVSVNNNELYISLRLIPSTNDVSTGSSPPPASSPKACKTSDPAKAMSFSQTPTGRWAGAASSTVRLRRARERRWRCRKIFGRRRRRNRPSWWRTCSLGSKKDGVDGVSPDDGIRWRLIGGVAALVDDKFASQQPGGNRRASMFASRSGVVDNCNQKT